jgi:hypothetical protein
MAEGKYKVRKSIREQSFVINLFFMFLIKLNVQKIYVSLISQRLSKNDLLNIFRLLMKHIPTRHCEVRSNPRLYRVALQIGSVEFGIASYLIMTTWFLFLDSLSQILKIIILISDNYLLT